MIPRLKLMVDFILFIFIFYLVSPIWCIPYNALDCVHYCMPFVFIMCRPVFLGEKFSLLGIHSYITLIISSWSSSFRGARCMAVKVIFVQRYTLNFFKICGLQFILKCYSLFKKQLLHELWNSLYGQNLICIS